MKWFLVVLAYVHAGGQGGIGVDVEVKELKSKVDLYGKSGVCLTHLSSPPFKLNGAEAIQI